MNLGEPRRARVLVTKRDEREIRRELGKVLAKRKIKQIDGRPAFKVPVNGAEETRAGANDE